MKDSDAYKQWYAKNKDDLAKRRKAKYLSDPEYKQKAIERAQSYRSKKAAEARTKLDPKYTHTATEAAELLGVSPAVLRGWHKRQLYPTPLEFQGKRYFTEAQVALLSTLSQYLQSIGWRAFTEEERQKLAATSATVFANW